MSALKVFLFFPLFLFCLVNITAGRNQDSVVDSLTKVLENSKPDTFRVNTLIRLSENLMQTSDYNKALKYAQEALALSEKIKFKKGISEAHNNVGFVCFMQGNYPEALKNQLVSLKIEEEIGNKHGMAKEYNRIGNTYSRLSNYTEALRNYSASLKIAGEIDDKSEIVTSYSSIGSLNGLQKNYPEALKYYGMSLKIGEEINDKRGISVCYNNIGNVYLLQGNNQGALKNYLNSLKICKQRGDKQGIAAAYINLGALYIMLKKTDEAKEYLDTALHLSRTINDKNEILEIYTSLSLLDSISGNFKEEYKQLLLFSDIKDSILNEKSDKQISQLRIQYETEKKEKELATLTIENELQVRKTKQRNLYILVSTSLLLLILSVVWFQSYKRQKRLIISDKEIEKKNLELKNKDLSIEKEKAEERINVQREIAEQYHDILGSKITSLIFMCENEKTEGMKQDSSTNEFATQVCLKLKEIAETNRSGIIALDPNTAQLHSFLAKLWSDLYDLVETAGKEIVSIIPKNIPDIRIEPIVKFNLSTVLKKAINNSIKYSGANEIVLEVEIANTSYVIRIIDKGIGIDPEKEKNHSYGLTDMKNKMKKIGGNCQVLSEMNKGTIIMLKGDFTFIG